MSTEDDTNNSYSLNALQDNIRKKGKNAYYYAHQNSKKEEDLVYDDKPRKLDTEIRSTNNFYVPIKKYSWADFKKSVKVYIDLEGIDSLPNENIVVDFSPEAPQSIKVKLLNIEGKDHELVLGKLHEKISNASVTKKENNRLVITLSKVEELTWYDLQLK